MLRKKPRLVTLLAFLPFLALPALVGGPVARAAEAPAKPNPSPGGVVRLSNEFIQVVVNASPDATGRFSVSTTGGNPDRADDDNRPLIYGGEEPWTSFTTVRLDGQNYVFGGATHLPAGRGGPFGTRVTAPRLVENGQGIEAAWQFPGQVEVIQRLGITRGHTTGLLDTVRIEYVLVNHDQQPHTVGLRIVLDTMAGSNDGAPFRVGERAVESDTSLQGVGRSTPEFFQVFDSLSRPAVIAQGTLRGGEITPPDRVYFTNWGVLRESLWDFDFKPGRTFERKGEYELDSAVALFYEPQPLAAGASRSIVVYYGLGGISIAPGQLAVGLSGPETAIIGQNEPLTIVSYVQNTGRGDARSVKIRLALPDGLELAPGEQAERDLGSIGSGATKQAVWSVRVTAGAPTEVTYSARAEATNAEPNTARRTMRLVAPARLSVRLRGPARIGVVDGRWDPSPFEVVGSVTNEGGVEAYGVSAQLVTIYGLRIAPGASAWQYVGTLRPGETVDLSWLVTPTGVSGNVPYSLKVAYQGAGEQPVPTNTVVIPPLPIQILVKGGAGWTGQGLAVGKAFNVEILARNLPPFARGRIDVAFDPAVLRLVAGALSVDRGTLFVAGGEGAQEEGGSSFTVEAADSEAGRVTVSVAGPKGVPAGQAASLLVLRLAVKGAGAGSVRIQSAEFRDAAGQVVYRLGPPGPLPELEVTATGKAAPLGKGSSSKGP
ncbi:hypothetical protein U7230_05720 [Carboxydochorda subterranea]|uniref:CARDB domain-containing protein n=1 Tax=Carboxydichorda subterranea TaxID=3109565 RepID=A0ABZ1C171_9FIRM|nr:hypothetical protein [Limnochorda sp. L945t]WRP18501.1 hypothetical protein U7230_05720 [Limnochorda sp. L945t]